MKRTPKKSSRDLAPLVPRGRWDPKENTRPQVFRDRKKTADKNACRGSGWGA